MMQCVILEMKLVEVQRYHCTGWRIGGEARMQTDIKVTVVARQVVSLCDEVE